MINHEQISLVGKFKATNGEQASNIRKQRLIIVHIMVNAALRQPDMPYWLIFVLSISQGLIISVVYSSL